MLVESLELPSFIFGLDKAQEPPTTHAEMLVSLADRNTITFERLVLPRLYVDVLGRIYHQDYPDVEIINEEEKRRFDANMVLLFSILTSCTSSAILNGIYNGS